jgi:poly(3-hydroxybutyrate) depolymerase
MSFSTTAWAAAFVIDPGRFYLAGFSQGAAFAYRLAARAEEPLTGLLILDGSARGPRSSGEGGAVIDVGGVRLPYPERARLLADVIADPTRPSPVAGYASAGGARRRPLLGEELGGRGGLTNARWRVRRPYGRHAITAQLRPLVAPRRARRRRPR